VVINVKNAVYSNHVIRSIAQGKNGLWLTKPRLKAQGKQGLREKMITQYKNAKAVIGRFFFSTSVLIFTSLPATAQTSSPPAASLSTLQKHVNEKQYTQAHSLTQALMDEHGGEPVFDYLAGQAAYYTQHYQEAVFAFERVMLNRPNHARARLLLAFSYFKVKNYGAAQVELNQLISLTNAYASEEEKAQIQAYLTQIERIQQKHIKDKRLSLSLGLGYDSNVSSGTEEDAIFFPSVDDFITITGGTEASDSLAELNLTYQYKKKRTQQSDYRFYANWQHLHHQDLSEFDRSVVNLNASFSDYWQDTRYTLTGYVQPMMLDSKYYRTAYGVIGELSWALGQHWRWAISSNISRINNTQVDSQDMRRIGASTRFTYLSKHPQIIELSYHDDDGEIDAGKHNGKDYYALSYTYLYPVSSVLNIAFKANAEKSQFDRPHPTFLAVRDDDGYAFSVKADYHLDAHWQLSTFLRYSRKNSNLALYDYDRSELKATVTHVF